MRIKKWVGEHKLVIVGCIWIMPIVILGSIITLMFAQKKSTSALSITRSISPTVTLTPTKLPSSTPTASPSATPTMTPIKKTISSKMIFGIGSQAGPAMDFRIVKEAPVTMLTSWYNKPSDLEWMRIQQNDLIPRLYKHPYIVHLITWTDLPEGEVDTPHGKACGRAYPVSSQVVEDMKQLAQIYNGPGVMYVSLFTEFQTYTCTDNNWIGNENYYMTLKDNYRKIKDIFHQNAPNSKVAISWGGWSSRYDDTEHKGGRSLFPYFADVMSESDFTAFQTMESDTNIQEILDMTRILGGYKRPVMLAHYKPYNSSNAVFNADMKALFTDSTMQTLRNNGLFAISYMDNELLESSEESYGVVKAGISKYGQ